MRALQEAEKTARAATDQESDLQSPSFGGAARRGAKRIWKTLLSLFLSALLFYLAFIQIQSKSLLDSLGRFDSTIVALLILLAAVRIFAVTQRWRLLLVVMATDPGFATSLRLTYEGALLNGFLPGSIAGDPYRILRLRGLGMGLSAASFATLLDRFVGVLTLAGLGFLGLVWALWSTGTQASPGSVLVAIAGLGCLAVAVMAALLFADRSPVSLPWIGDWVARELPGIRSSLKRLMRNPRQIMSVVGLSLLGHLALALMFVVPLATLTPQLSLGASLAMGFAISLAQLLPFSVGGWGVRELAAVSGFGLIGVAGPDALATSIAVGAVNSLILVPASLLFLLPRLQKQIGSHDAAGPATMMDRE
ncbi:lysylphosphatidylglycerol synthase transmembrane domain-containing protein [Limibacillus sp. MBR-115]|jgi:uncharacterized protein (TIRG00374 family)|uniref:lysylphosphatidylglycerol synthase transmembrane domain-containing protein n=1 Tax=Limibacillus sp. MBR-115 TaxID=3156465 RepID=UPI0033982549